MKWHEIDTLDCPSGTVVILNKENFDRIAACIDMTSEELLDTTHGVEVDLNCKDKIVGIDLVHPVHVGNVVTNSILIHAYPDKIQRFLHKDELTFDEYKLANPNGDYQKYLDRDPRKNSDLDRALGILPEVL